MAKKNEETPQTSEIAKSEENPQPSEIAKSGAPEFLTGEYLGKPNRPPLDLSLLKGLSYKTSKAVMEQNRTTYKTITRSLTPDDVLDWRDDGPAVIIVAADGHKFTITKPATE